MRKMCSRSNPRTKHCSEVVSEGNQGQCNSEREIFAGFPINSQGQHKNDSNPLTSIEHTAGLNPNLRGETTDSLHNVETEKLDARYKVLPRSNFFKIGRVFKVLWSEPASIQEASKTYTENSSYIPGEKRFSQIRRFVVTAPSQGPYMCLPVMTYSGQGTIKSGIRAAHHAIIYTSNRSNEQRSLSSAHVPKATLAITDKLDPVSRLNYAKTYTVEQNFKDKFIGKLDRNSIDGGSDLKHSVCANREEFADTDRNSPSTPNVMAMDFRVNEDNTFTTSDQLDDQYMTHHIVIDVLDDLNLVEKNEGLFLILDDETCNHRRYSHIQRLIRVMTSPKALAGIGMSSGLLMGASFLWLNNRMELNHTSQVMDWVEKIATRNLSAATRDSLGLIPNGIVFAIFVFATANLSFSSIAWMLNNTQNPGAKSFGWAISVTICVFCIYAAVTIEELLLVCLPLSVGFGILSSLWFGQTNDEDMAVKQLVYGV